MTNETIILKLQQRLDKLDSFDFQNVETWMYLEAFNKAYIQWIRRQLEGINQERAGNESTTRRIDDLQFILTVKPITMTDGGIYWSGPIPTDYLQYCRMSAFATSDCCPPRFLEIYESTEIDRDVNLSNSGKQPNYDWATTFSTLLSNTIRVYTNGLFGISDAQLTYYRTPANIEIAGVADPYTGGVSGANVLCEAPDNVIELIIEEARGILAGDIQNYTSMQVGQQSVERNT